MTTQIPHPTTTPILIGEKTWTSMSSPSVRKGTLKLGAWQPSTSRWRLSLRRSPKQFTPQVRSSATCEKGATRLPLLKSLPGCRDQALTVGVENVGAISDRLPAVGAEQRLVFDIRDDVQKGERDGFLAFRVGRHHGHGILTFGLCAPLMLSGAGAAVNAASVPR